MPDPVDSRHARWAGRRWPLASTAVLAGWDGEAVFVPGEVPRAGVLALWGAGTGPDLVEVVVPCNTWGVRKRWAAATLVPVAEALPALLAVDPNAPGVRHSLAVWATAAVAGVGLISRGRLLPAVTADGADAWRVGPLDPADLVWRRELAAAFPPAANALAMPGTRPMRLFSPLTLVRDFWDAIADTLVRTVGHRAPPGRVPSPQPSQPPLTTWQVGSPTPPAS